MGDMEILRALLAAAAGAASSADPDIKAFGEAVGGQCQELAASKGIDLSAPAPASEAEAAPAAAPEAAGADMDEKIEKAVASAVAKALASLPARPAPLPLPAAVASKGMTPAEVQRIAREESERSRLLDANKDVLGPEVVNLLSGKPLPEVKSFVAALASKASKGQGGEAPRAPQLGTVEGKSYSLAERYSGKQGK